MLFFLFFFSSRRRHTRFKCDWSSDVCSSDLECLKISPEVSAAELKDILAVCEDNRVGAIIATNTTLDHSSVPSQLDQAGGLSGAPLREKSTALIRETAARSTIPVIASGGICDAAS